MLDDLTAQRVKRVRDELDPIARYRITHRLGVFALEVAGATALATFGESPCAVEDLRLDHALDERDGRIFNHLAIIFVIAGDGPWRSESATAGISAVGQRTDAVHDLDQARGTGRTDGLVAGF